MLKKSPLIPEWDPKKLDYETWNQHTSEEHTWELWNGMPFSPDGGVQRDRLALCLIYSMGLEHLAKLLPEQTKKELLQILTNSNDNI